MIHACASRVCFVCECGSKSWRVSRHPVLKHPLFSAWWYRFQGLGSPRTRSIPTRFGPCDGPSHAQWSDTCGGPNTDRPGSATAYRKVLPLGKAGKQFHLVQSLQAMHAVCISSFAVCYSGSHPQARQVCLALSSRSARPRKRNPSTVWSEYVPLRFDSLSLFLSLSLCLTETR